MESKAADIKLLQGYEDRVKRGLSSLLDAAEALAIIREQKLYLCVERSWKGYCRSRLGITGSYAETIIRYGRIAKELPSPRPSTVAQMAELASIESKATRAMVWREAVKEANQNRPRTEAKRLPNGPEVAKVRVDVTGHSRGRTLRASSLSRVWFVRDVEVMADRIIEHYSDAEIQHLVSALVGRVMRKAA